MITASCLSITFALLGNYIVRIFTNDVQMINLVTKLLAIDIVLEFGRVTNLVYGQALKTSGDAVFPVVMGAVFMYLAAVGGTYFFGLHLGLLAVGAYIGLASDECIRAIGMVLRWKSGKWKNKGSGRIRDWLIRACIPPFASPFQSLQTSYSVSLLKSHYISVTKYLKYMKHLQ